MSDGKKSQGSEAALGWGILLCVFAALGYLVWWKLSEEMRSAVRWLRYCEMWVMSFFVDKDYEVTWQGQKVNYHELMEMAHRIPADRIDGNLISALSTVMTSPGFTGPTPSGVPV